MCYRRYSQATHTRLTRSRKSVSCDISQLLDHFAEVGAASRDDSLMVARSGAADASRNCQQEKSIDDDLIIRLLLRDALQHVCI